MWGDGFGLHIPWRHCQGYTLVGKLKASGSKGLHPPPPCSLPRSTFSPRPQEIGAWGPDGVRVESYKDFSPQDAKIFAIGKKGLEHPSTQTTALGDRRQGPPRILHSGGAERWCQSCPVGPLARHPAKQASISSPVPTLSPHHRGPFMSRLWPCCFRCSLPPSFWGFCDCFPRAPPPAWPWPCPPRAPTPPAVPARFNPQALRGPRNGPHKSALAPGLWPPQLLSQLKAAHLLPRLLPGPLGKALAAGA